MEAVIPVFHQKTAHNASNRDPNVAFKDVVEELRTRESMRNVGRSLISLEDVIEKVDCSIEKMNKEKADIVEEQKRKDRWLVLFDRIDLLLFVVFQAIHIVFYLTLYYHAN